MTKLDRLLAKPHKVLLWAFTGLIVVSTVITLLEPTATSRSKKTIKDKKGSKKQPKTPEELERDSRDVSTWTKKELFEYLTRVSIKGCVKIYSH